MKTKRQANKRIKKALERKDYTAMSYHFARHMEREAKRALITLAKYRLPIDFNI